MGHRECLLMFAQGEEENATQQRRRGRSSSKKRRKRTITESPRLGKQIFIILFL